MIFRSSVILVMTRSRRFSFCVWPRWIRAEKPLEKSWFMIYESSVVDGVTVCILRVAWVIAGAGAEYNTVSGGYRLPE